MLTALRRIVKEKLEKSLWKLKPKASRGVLIHHNIKII